MSDSNRCGHAQASHARLRPRGPDGLLPIFLGAALMAFSACSTVPESSRLLPAEIEGWKAGGPDGLYGAETLFDYIDGGAEVYRALNVREVRARKYVREGAPEIIADLFDMGSSSDAFGAYHHDLRDGESAGIGQESERSSGALAFWKGRYFASITALGETEDARRTILALGRRIAESIPDAGAPPDLRRWLPGDGLRAEQIRYFHIEPSLNIYYRLAEGNPLGLHARTEGILARYDSGGGAAPDESGRGGHVLLLVRYPSEGEASQAVQRFRSEFLPVSDAQGIARTLQGKWDGVRAAGDLLIAVLDAPARVDVEKAVGEVLRLRGPA